MRLKKEIPNDAELIAYLKPQWQWIDAIQNDFAARADWCVKSYDQANHPPAVKLDHAPDMNVRPGEKVALRAKGTTDPDGDALSYRWWQYEDADAYGGIARIENGTSQDADSGGNLRFRFCPRDPKVITYKISSNVPGLDGKTGEISAFAPPPSAALNPSPRYPNWWTDDPSPAMTEHIHYGARSVSQGREEYLHDFFRANAPMRRGHSTTVACGYDLRATPGRCPECAAASAIAISAASRVGA